MLTAGYVDVNQKYEYVLYLYIVMGLFGLGNYLALSPNDLTLIRINAFATVILFRFAFHECGSLACFFPPKTGAVLYFKTQKVVHATVWRKSCFRLHIDPPSSLGSLAMTYYSTFKVHVTQDKALK